MASDTGAKPADTWLIGNEFAAVRVSVDHQGHDPRLKIEDVEHGTSILLDPLILASLARGWLDDLSAHLFPFNPEDPQ
ncbi:hypothetical protein [Acuticoccus mangrovi]|uniref:Dihydrodiol dehydrogenase n=1 Tax=Acuticoccus mangrovi TaxID=2796142 RepID=A0A934IT41_9HYPH|nr:hypothetical protein [Acuticoccus mangrovi]MBJ3778133.1 hypothetical protein [Acuticoccus mangrovi]